jgi:site-specific recombinase XerD
MGELVDPMASVRAYLAAEKSDNTRRAYRTDFDHYTAWCDSQELQALPGSAETVARYLAFLADSGLKPSTIERRRAAIRYAHKAGGYEPPTAAEGVKATMRGIRRTKRSRIVRKAPATSERIVQMLSALPDNLIGRRDRALLLIAFAAALRRSELVALDVLDVDWFDAGIVITLQRSKTDQEGRGRTIAVPNGSKLTPVDALQFWLVSADIREGPIFRGVDRHGRVSKEALTDRSVARIIKRAAKAAGLDETAFSGHSPRAGFVTQALTDKVDPFKIMTVTGHRKVDTLKIYDRRDAGLQDPAGKDFL